MSERDIEGASAAKGTAGSGRNVIAVIGIDHYHHWQPLSNAVRDAIGAATLFQRLGFEEVTAPLLDDRATGMAIQSLVTDDLMALGPEDSLVLFYAGHGGTRKHRLGGEEIKAGYLIPADAAVSPDKVSTWVELEGWLRAVSLLPAKHILVVLDTCHSGIALDPIIKWRDIGTWQDTPLATLRARRSRRIITSALDDQVALDSGPVRGHSLFTGCLIEGLTNGIARGGSRVTTGSELGLYVQRRVQTYPYSRQTPDFGTFAFDDRGEMIIPLAIDPVIELPAQPAVEASSSAWLDLIDLEDQPEPASQPEPRLSNMVPGSEGEVSSVPIGTVELDLAPPVLSPLLPPRLPAEIAQPVTSTPNTRRWIAAGTVSATLVITVIGYLIFGRKSSRGEDPIGTPPRVAASNPPDARLVDTPSRVAEAEPSDAQLQSGGSTAGHCPPGMVPVPEGTFRMGSPEGVGDDDELPQHEVTLTAYCIDRTEVTVKAYAACVAAKGCSPAPLTVHWSVYSASDVKLHSRFCNRDDHPDQPINCVDWDQAAAYCKWANKRLPTEAEWEYAARGTDGRAYPWGSEVPSAKRLNACGSECVAVARRELNRDGHSMYDASDGWENTAPVGRFLEGASPFGVLDMAGNVWEWTADWYGPYTAVAMVNPRGAETGTVRVVRGGAWSDYDAGNVRAAYRRANEPSNRRNSVGFRCARGD